MTKPSRIDIISFVFKDSRCPCGVNPAENAADLVKFALFSSEHESGVLFLEGRCPSISPGGEIKQCLTRKFSTKRKPSWSS